MTENELGDSNRDAFEALISPRMNKPTLIAVAIFAALAIAFVAMREEEVKAGARLSR